MALGDIAQNYRSALDHFVYAMAKQAAGGVAPPDAQLLTFPICSTAKSWAGAARKLRGLTEQQRDQIHALQPIGRSVTTSSLVLLNEVNRVDNHREVRLGFVASTAVRVPRPVPEGFERVEFVYAPLQDGDVALKVHVTHPVPPTRLAGFDVGLTPSIDVESGISGIGDEQIPLPLDLVLKEFEHAVTSALNALSG